MLATDFVCVLTQVRMAAALGVPFRQFETITVLHYAEGEEITEHFDFVDPEVPDYEQEIMQRGQRIATFLIYLNDAYDGGETEFPRVGVRHKGCKTQGIVFINALPDGAADVRTLHAGRPPRGGEKWIVSQFVRDRQVF
jgi:prolyl 4-hydroxylase